MFHLILISNPFRRISCTRNNNKITVRHKLLLLLIETYKIISTAYYFVFVYCRKTVDFFAQYLCTWKHEYAVR